MARCAPWVIALLAICAAADATLPRRSSVLRHVPGEEDSSSEECVFESGVDEDGERWPRTMVFPDGDGRPVVAQVQGSACYQKANRDDVKFKLYTRNGPLEGEDLTYGNIDQLRGSTFDPSLPTRLLTHGFFSSISSHTIQDMKNMYIGFTEGNVVAVDWWSIAKNPLYFIVKRQTVPVGGFVADFVTFLVQEGGAHLRNIHLVGHSLGAHVMGIAGKGLETSLSSKVDRITGLDPAGPLFSLRDIDHRLDRGDGDFVDIIHTCGGWLGFRNPIGHVDFFPNGGGLPQPGCTGDRLLMGVCSHSRAWMYFAESINSRNFTSLSCEDYDDFLQGHCDRDLRSPMGEPTSTGISDKYYLQTASSPPFALG